MRGTIYPKAAVAKRNAAEETLDAARHIERPDHGAGDVQEKAVFAVVGLLSDVLSAVRTTGWFVASSVVSAGLRKDRTLHSRERRYVGDTVHHILRHLRRLRVLCNEKQPSALALYAAHLLDTSLVDTSPVDTSDLGRMPPFVWHRLLSRSRLHPDEVLAQKRALDNRLLKVAQAAPDEQVRTLGEALSYPDWLVSLFLAEFGVAQTETLLRVQSGRAPLTLRVNPCRMRRAELLERLGALGFSAQATPLSPWGVTLSTHVNVYTLPLFQEGFFEVQDEASQLVTALCAPPANGLVLDVCAGAGGKTLGLSAMMGNRGRVLALDPDPDKLLELKKRARRAGLTNIETLCAKDAALPQKRVGAGADRVLVDAPCSGLGVLRRNPEARWRLAEKDLAELSDKQRLILRQAAKLVAKNGHLIYATCTLVRRENDDVIDEFLAQHPEFAEVPLSQVLPETTLSALPLSGPYRLRTWPQKDGPDGFFAALLKRIE